MRYRHVIAGLLTTLAAAALFGQTRDGSSGGKATTYRVTPWPDHAPDSRYGDEVEQHLNRMAADGWRYHSETTGQGARMMVFERVASK